MSIPEKTLHATVSGLVQGVGYRAFAQKSAMHLHLTGWVKNRPDGKVEITVTGPEDSLENYIAQLRKGPAFSHVKHVETEFSSNVQVFAGFEILK